MIIFTQGDTALISLTAQGFNITGATLTTYVKGVNGALIAFANSQHTITDGPNGKFTVLLATTDTAKCGAGPNKEIITKVVNGSSTIYFHGPSILTVLIPTPIV